jgi:signal recognition particle receptor subunit beta
MSNDREIHQAAGSVTAGQVFRELYAYLADTDDGGDVEAGWARLRHAIDGRQPSSQGSSESHGISPATELVARSETITSTRNNESAIQPRQLNYLDSAIVHTAGHIGPTAAMPAPYRALRQSCAQPRRLSDIAAELGWSLPDLRELVSDMADLGLVTVCLRAGCLCGLPWTEPISFPGHGTLADGSPACARPAKDARTSAAIVIAGGCGIGKTTLITSLSEQTQYAELADITPAADDPTGSSSTDSLRGRVELGRITLATDLDLYLLAAPDHCMQHRMYDEWVRGTIGALVLVDPRRPEDSSAAIDYFQSRDCPFVVAIRQLHWAETHLVETIREALQLGSEVPALTLITQEPYSGRQALVSLTEHAIQRIRAKEPTDEDDTAQTQARVLVSLQGAI